MKKLSILLFFLVGCAALTNAQKRFTIQVISDSVANLNTNATDYVHIGDQVILYITLQNYGVLVNGNYQPDSFPGGTYTFKNNVDLTENRSHVKYTQTLNLPGMAYKGVAIIQDTIEITSMLYIRDTVNIIIVWPGGGSIDAGKDNIDTTISHFNASYNFFVYPHDAGINNLVNSDNTFKIYPNPAKDAVSIEMNETGSGIIRLMDITGKLIAEKPYAAKAGERVNLPLNQTLSMPDGMYLIGIQNNKGYSVGKVVIER